MRAFVPTMGALHAGHQSLISHARTLADEVVVSIFVNPLQFENKEDLEKYPRTPELDEKLARDAGATRVWFPKYEEIYPGDISMLSAGTLGNLYEGASRPGHFDGVVTVVRRLFDLVQPDIAIFGEKDFQQLTLIRTIAGDVKIITAPTVRESDGLALSSRNVRLSSDGRTAATVISRALYAARECASISEMNQVLSDVLASEPAFTLDYALVVDENDLSPATDSTQSPRAIIAGWINGVRLIDNMQMRAVVR